jgi:hypothetical protein
MSRYNINADNVTKGQLFEWIDNRFAMDREVGAQDTKVFMMLPERLQKQIVACEDMFGTVIAINSEIKEDDIKFTHVHFMYTDQDENETRTSITFEQDLAL